MKELGSVTLSTKSRSGPPTMNYGPISEPLYTKINPDLDSLPIPNPESRYYRSFEFRPGGGQSRPLRLRRKI